MESLPRRNSDADFPDVFGGQPRRGRGCADSFDFYSSWGGREEGVAHRSRWSAGPSEKPVFGELNSPARPRHLADDFFTDIFQGSESSCSSPRRGERDGFPSSPGSRVLSPTFPAMLSSSLPRRLSLSMKQAKGLDYPVFSSPTHRAINKNDNAAYDSFASSIPSSSNANASVPFVTTRAVPVQEDQRYDGYASYRQSPLSCQYKGNMDLSVEATDSAGRAQEDTTCLEGHSRSNYFHFSIYKWAGKGVTLVMPSSSGEHAKNSSRLRILPELVLQGVDVPTYDDYISTKAGASKVQTENESNKVLKNLTRERKDEADSIIMGDLLPSKFQFKVLRKEITEESRGEMEPLDVFSKASCDTASGEVSFTMREEWKPELKNLHQLLESESYRQVGSQDIIMQDQGIEVSTRDPSDADDDLNAKHRDGIKHVEVSSANMQENQATTTSVEDKLPGRRVKGKVKEFIKIFNQEVSVKPKGKIENLDRKTRQKDGKNDKVDVQATVYASKMDEEINTSRMNTSVFEDSSIAANQVSKKVEGPKYNISSDVNMIHDSSAGRNDNLFPCSEPPPESFDSSRGIFEESPTKQAPPKSFDSSTGNLEESHSGYLDGCLVEQLCKEQNEHAQTDSHQDQIQISDAKIREWSKGKEGNIRSLLSTLQYVLWSDSGWKPIPLVDIIEATSVKRAYQKALLCLHPDKLQQKGAAMHQKYIAEKVFDILQEAWTHFNSISSIG